MHRHLVYRLCLSDANGPEVPNLNADAQTTFGTQMKLIFAAVRRLICADLRAIRANLRPIWLY